MVNIDIGFEITNTKAAISFQKLLPAAKENKLRFNFKIHVTLYKYRYVDFFIRVYPCKCSVHIPCRNEKIIGKVT